MREANVEAYFVAQVKAHGGEQRKLKWIGRRHGPDRFVKLPGIPVVLVELKRPGGALRPGQEREIARLQAVGVDVFVIYTKEGVDDFMRRVLKWQGRNIQSGEL
ncbi:VRR-NUC domain-containing protein [Burkholderia anthina]|uniref:VRR-NUC domain-containing protein n=1 Tax=Burkholderia anthina TaxID=179879 RepID=UPI001AA01091|nr:VRR-NUC domain-containing protein [Burkholderia anthina]QTD88917.1 VRR-NUC domain-containing protein [Burkholderia anthina]